MTGIIAAFNGHDGSAINNVPEEAKYKWGLLLQTHFKRESWKQGELRQRIQVLILQGGSIYVRENENYTWTDWVKCQ